MSHPLKYLLACFTLSAAALIAQGPGAGEAWAGQSTLAAGQSLANDASIVSDNGKYKAVMQKSDGHLVVYDTSSGAAVWAAPTSGGTGWFATMQTDGNLVVYDGGKSAKWAAGTNETKPVQYFLKIEDSGDLNVYKGTTALPVGVIWSSRTGRRYKYVSDVDIAKSFRPHLRFGKNTRCFALNFTDGGDAQGNGPKDSCGKSYDPKFVVFAEVVKPADGTVANTDGNSFRIVYGVAFGYQQGTYTGVAQAYISQFHDAGDHGEDAQYMVVDVVNGAVTSVWADMHEGFYARSRGELAMDGDHVVAWVGEYYHPLKLVRETSSLCKSEPDGYGLSDNVTSTGLRFVCLGTCGSARSCMPYDTILNWGDPAGETYQGEGQLAIVTDVCNAQSTYNGPDGTSYYSSSKGGSLDSMKGYLGCLRNDQYWTSTLKSKDAYTRTYSLDGCKSGNTAGGSICNATHFGEGKKWVTSRATSNLYIEPAVAGSADVDYAAGNPFNDLPNIGGVLKRIVYRTGKRVDSVIGVWTSGGSQESHGGDGGSQAILDGLDKDPVVRVELCSAKIDGKVRAGHVKFQTYKGVMQQGGGGYDNCQTIAPYGKALYGFYGRAGGEMDMLGTIWGDLPSGFPAKQTSW